MRRVAKWSRDEETVLADIILSDTQVSVKSL